MEKNRIIQQIEIVAGTNRIEFISGTVNACGTKECILSDERGSVYGIAVELNEEEKLILFKEINKSQHKGKFFPKLVIEWKTIGDNYYPLYWGKDINMGVRLHAHTKEMKSTGTLQLNNLNLLKGKNVIYGAIPCLEYDSIEKNLHNKFPDVLKTLKGNKDELQVNSFCEDENDK